MRWRFNIIVVLMPLAVSLSGQDCAYEKYYYWCNFASMDYAEGKIKEAARKYQVAFDQVSFPLGIELDFAFRLAAELGHTTQTQTLAVKLALGGVPMTYFEAFKSQSWYPSFVQDSAVYREYHEEHFDLQMRREVLDLYRRDSIFNDSYHNWRDGAIHLSEEDLIRGASAIADDFKNLVRDRGFPCEQKMGYYVTDSGITEYPLLPLLIHIYQRGELVYHDRFSYIVCDGKFRPSHWATLNKMRGFGDSTGVEQEMRMRYRKYSKRGG